MLNKKVIYTVITGGYDNLIEQPSVKGYDFVCFTDNPKLKSITWQIRPLPEGLEGLTSVKQQRNIKILAQETVFMRKQRLVYMLKKMTVI